MSHLTPFSLWLQNLIPVAGAIAPHSHIPRHRWGQNTRSTWNSKTKERHTCVRTCTERHPLLSFRSVLCRIYIQLNSKRRKRHATTEYFWWLSEQMESAPHRHTQSRSRYAEPKKTKNPIKTNNKTK